MSHPQTATPVDWERSYKPHTHTLGEWQKHFVTFKRLYVTEKRGLPDVREIMAREYDFYATEDQCRKKFTKWGLGKKIGKEMLVERRKDMMAEKRKKRSMDNDKETESPPKTRPNHKEGSDVSQLRFKRPMLAQSPEATNPPAFTPSGTNYWTPQGNNDSIFIQYTPQGVTSGSVGFSPPITMVGNYISEEQPVPVGMTHPHNTIIHNTSSSSSYSQHGNHLTPYPRGPITGGFRVNNNSPTMYPSSSASVSGHLDTFPADIGDWGLFPGNIAKGDTRNTLEFEEIECLQALFRYANQSLECITNTEFKEAHRLISHFGNNPLAIKLAGTYIAKTGGSFAAYLPFYLGSFQIICRRVPMETIANDRRCAIAAFEISFEAMRRQDVLAAEFLHMCAYIHNDNIFDDLIKRGLPQTHSTGKLIEVLLSYSMIDRLPSGKGFSIPSTIHSWLRERLDFATGQRKLEDAARFVATLVTTDYRQCAGLTFGRRVLPHLAACWQYIKQYLLSTPKIESWCIVNSMTSMGFGFSYQGQIKEAKEVDTQLLAMQKAVLGETHPETLVSMSCLAWTLLGQGQWREAEDLGRRAMILSREALGEEHADSLDSATTFAAIIKEKGRWKEAEELEIDVLATRNRVFGEAHRKNLPAMCNLAWTFSRQGRWKEAEDLGMKTVSIMKEQRGEAHKHTLRATSNLARTISRQGRWKESVRLEAAVLAIKRRVFGEVHPDTLESISNLGWTFSRQGRWKEAEVLQVGLLATRTKELGEAHPETLDAISNLAWTFSRQGRLKEAEEMQAGVLATRQKVLGEVHPNTLMSMTDLAWLFSKQQRWEEAENLGAQAVAMTNKELGETHPDTLVSVSNLAMTLSGQERWEEAEDLGVQIVTTMKKELGETHPNTLESMANLAWTISGQGRWKEAEDLGVQVVEMMMKNLGETHPDTVESIKKLKSYQITRIKVRKDLLRLLTVGDEHGFLLP